MRKYLLPVIVSLLSLGCAEAQRVNINAGGGLASHYGSSTRPVGAVKIGVSYEWELSTTWTLECGPEFYVKGFKDRNTEVYMRDSEGNLVLDDNGNPMMGKKNVSTTAYYVELPIKANYYIELRPLHYIELSAGPYAAVGVGGKRKTRGDTDETDEARRFFYEKNTFSERGVKRFDAGLRAAVAYEFNRQFAVGIEADFGMLRFSDSGGHNVSGLLTLSYRLPIDL